MTKYVVDEEVVWTHPIRGDLEVKIVDHPPNSGVYVVEYLRGDREGDLDWHTRMMAFEHEIQGHVEPDEPCCRGYVTSGGDDRCHEPGCPDE